MTSRPIAAQQVDERNSVDRSFHGSRNLDLLRSAAVAFVYIGHLFSALSLNKSVFFSVLARAGVMIFFVHTSLVLMLSMERMRENGPALVRHFLIRRTFRIYPLSICCVLLVIAVHIPFMPLELYHWPGWNSVLSNLLLIQNISRVRSVIGPLWSLPWEVQMYLALPFLFLSWRVRPWTTLIAAWVLTSVVSAAGAVTGFRATQLFVYVPCFLGGILALTLARKRMQPSMPAYLWPIVICTICFIFAKFNPSAWTRRIIYPEWLMCAGLGLLIPLFREMSPKTILAKVAATIAKYSYGIYLIHVPAIWFSFVVLRSTHVAIRVCCLAAMSIVLPMLAYHGIENPLIQLGKRVTSSAHAHTTS